MMLSVCASPWGTRLERQRFTHSFNKHLILTSSLIEPHWALGMGKIQRDQRCTWTSTNNLISKTDERQKVRVKAPRKVSAET